MIGRVFGEIRAERKRQDEKWGEQNLPMLNIPFSLEAMQNSAKALKALNDDGQHLSWFSILLEGVYGAFAETEPEKQRGGMVQVAAVAVQVIESLDRMIEQGTIL